jgi:hypothetical protein
MALAGLFLFWEPAAAGALLLAGLAGVWWRGTRRAAQVLGLVDGLASRMGLVRCDGGSNQHSAVSDQQEHLTLSAETDS